jgi:hypothetical protein
MDATDSSVRRSVVHGGGPVERTEWLVPGNPPTAVVDITVAVVVDTVPTYLTGRRPQVGNQLGKVVGEP